MQLNQYKYSTVPVLLKSKSTQRHKTYNWCIVFVQWQFPWLTWQERYWSMQQSSFYESMKYKILSKIVLYNSTQISAIYCKYASSLHTEKWLCSQTHEYISIRYKYMNTQRQNMYYMYDRALYRSSATSSADLACILGPAASIINLSPSARTARKHTALYHQCIQYTRQYST